MIVSYNIFWKDSARKELKKLPPQHIKRILEKVEFLKDNPYNANSKKLKGSEFTYRLRVGDYRVVYTVENDRLVIQVVKVGHRKDIYR